MLIVPELSQSRASTKLALAGVTFVQVPVGVILPPAGAFVRLKLADVAPAELAVTT